MQLTTRCPECGVCFDVSLKELQLRKGYVRCVQCANIFDGYEAVVPSSERKQTGAHPESAASPASKPEKPFFHRLELPPISRPARSPASQLGGSTTPEPTIPNEPASAGRQEPVFTLGSTHDADSQLPKTRSDLIRRGRPRHPDADSQEHQGRYRHQNHKSHLGGYQAEHDDHDYSDRHEAADDYDDQSPGLYPARPERLAESPTSLGDAPTSLSDSRDTEEDREATAAIRFPRSTRTSSTSPIQSRAEATDAFRLLPDDAIETSEEIYLPPRDPDNPVLPGFLGEEESEPSRGFRVVWWVLIIVGLFVLLAQLLFVYRVAIANYMPSLRPVLEQACQKMACEVAYPRVIDALSITASSLKTDAKAQEQTSHDMTLGFVLRNAYDKPQQWPVLWLELSDFSGARVVQRALTPSEYLPQQLADQPFAANRELEINLPLHLEGLAISGYRLTLHFP